MPPCQEHIPGRKQLTESIALLSKLTDTPERPTENSIADYLQRNNDTHNRALSLPREKEIAETLAFLAATSDDPRKVTALCIEERLEGRGLVIRLAVNNGGLVRVKQGFENIASILERIACYGNPSLRGHYSSCC